MRVRIFGLLSALALMVLGAVPASATSEGHSYLALGDSVPFGFSPLKNPSDAANFIGYPEIVARALNIEDVNATCPGEATGGFLSLTGTDNVCRPYRSAFPLHVSYSGTQVAFATAYLKSHPRTRLVTLTLGANDAFRFQKDCLAGPTVGTCPLGLGGVAATMQANLNTILGAIRATGYTGLIVAVTYYSLDYSDVSGAVFLNGPMIAAANAHGALIADGLAAWAPAAAGGSACVAGLLIVTKISPLTCDVHPTPKGRDLLAGAVVSTIAASCPARSAIGCLDRSQG
ncbi:MAG: SGNH/GDSL hydrolase family protein [Chloroflexi bacterium]|nr:MAG: SGNH/GDSL hydrolase family protein [Chloroflexota bacterium]TMD69781.1 MAG: SGNH/GDSL hydrolase family protein [Chloroflexota bacterium]